MFDCDSIRRVVIKVDGVISIEFYVPANELGINLGSGLAASIDCYVAIGSKDQSVYIKVGTAIDFTTLNGCVSPFQDHQITLIIARSGSVKEDRAINAEAKTATGGNVERDAVGVVGVVVIFAGICGSVKRGEARAAPVEVLVRRRVNTISAGIHVNVFVIGN